MGNQVVLVMQECSIYMFWPLSFFIMFFFQELIMYAKIGVSKFQYIIDILMADHLLVGKQV